MRQKIQRRVLSILLVALCISACQPTPGKEAVVYKGEDYLHSDSEAPFVRLEVSDHLTYSRDLNGLRLDVDADVSIPGVDAYSVIEVEKARFTRADYERFVQYFLPEGTPLYTTGDLTKKQIAERIVEFEEVLAKEPNERYEGVLPYMYELYESAPDDASANSTLFSWEGLKSGDFFQPFFPVEGESYGCFNGTIDGNDFFIIRDYNTTPVGIDALEEGDLEWRDFSGEFPLTQQEAIAQAEQALRELGIEHLVATQAQKACAYHSLTPLRPVSKGWKVICTRESNGLPSYYVDGAALWGNAPAPELGAPWNAERVIVYVDAEGVYSFSWQGAGRQKRILVENVELLPLDDILERAEKQLMYQHLPQDRQTPDFRLEVNCIRLGSSLVSVANETEIGRMIPTWDFCYDILYENAETGQINSNSYVLTLNAIDGSYIEPRIIKTTVDEVMQEAGGRNP